MYKKNSYNNKKKVVFILLNWKKNRKKPNSEEKILMKPVNTRQQNVVSIDFLFILSTFLKEKHFIVFGLVKIV